MNGRFHQRQCNRAVPSSNMISKTDFVPPRKRFSPSATIFPRAVEASPFTSSEIFSEMPSVFVTARAVKEQQVFHCGDFQPGQLRRAFRANAPKRSNRQSQRRHCLLPGSRIHGRRNFMFRQRHLRHDTNRLPPLQWQTIDQNYFSHHCMFFMHIFAVFLRVFFEDIRLTRGMLLLSDASGFDWSGKWVCSP